MYTSGSTGMPKGVAIEHRNVSTLMYWARTVHSDEEIAGVLASASVCFDPSVLQIFFPLSFGGRLILADHPLEISALPARDEVTLVNVVPSAVPEILRARVIPASVRTMWLGGEAAPAELVDQIYAETQVETVIDMYGPSECTVDSIVVVREPGAPATIGRPIANTQAYVLDERREPVPIGAVGESVPRRRRPRAGISLSSRAHSGALRLRDLRWPSGRARIPDG